MKLSNLIVGATSIAVLAACGGGPSFETVPAIPAEARGQTAQVRCEPSPRMALEGRASPYDSTMIQVGDAHALVCYGRPSARGRTMLGGEQIPYGQLWRTGANEPTILHLPVAARVAGFDLEPGSYSLYTIPGEREWTVILNRSTAQWGHESQYTEAIRAQEVGRATLPVERTTEHVETFTIRSEPADAAAHMVLEWEHSRVRVPVERRS